MSEREAVERVEEPVTVASITEDLEALGVRVGDTLLVHSSLSALGWVCGGAPAVVDALQAALTESGTLVMPTHSSDYTDPGDWAEPPIPESWHERVRETMPPYRPEVTPTRGMGRVPECFRTYPETVRSAHPAVSFAAWGHDAESVVADHSLEERFGERSPLARVFDLEGSILLLGVGYETNTSLHLAEVRAPSVAGTDRDGGPVLVDGERVWVEYESTRGSTDDFAALGAAFERECAEAVTVGTVGAATARLIDQRALVDFAVEWFETNR
ncbi:AAC(3) family N-acetyltransferase [Natronobiforma cellulositropha]|uniref:aminoglycoside N(3)-acetyltransferase n=1 Tax=Natronobiforma cellulositropha TaxID=1679076 RepID=UPI0021D60A9D|nr:AAC(3) family N-acetyltransferase [Natronobiforma cellulositropha]